MTMNPRLRSDDDVEPGTALVMREHHKLDNIPVTVVAVHREDDGSVPQIIVRREDIGITLLASKTVDAVSLPPITTGPLMWLVHGGDRVSTDRQFRADDLRFGRRLKRAKKASS